MTSMKKKLSNILDDKIKGVRLHFLKRSNGTIEKFMEGINYIATAHEIKYKIKTDKSYTKMINFLSIHKLENTLFEYYDDPINLQNQMAMVTAFNALAINAESNNDSQKEENLNMLLAYHSIASSDIVNIITEWKLDPNLDDEALVKACQPKD